MNFAARISATLQTQAPALSGFYAKIHSGYAMALYDEKTLLELDAIRKIRNAFAHTPTSIHFTTLQIVAECKKLKSKLPFDEWPDNFSRELLRGRPRTKVKKNFNLLVKHCKAHAQERQREEEALIAA